MRSLSLPRVAMLALFAALAITQPGCLFGTHTTRTQTGNFVPASSFNQIKAGKTSAAFVEGTLGPPTTRTGLRDGTELWRWDYTETTNSSGYVFLIFAGSDSKEKRKSAFVQVENGVVVKAWRE